MTESSKQEIPEIRAEVVECGFDKSGKIYNFIIHGLRKKKIELYVLTRTGKNDLTKQEAESIAAKINNNSESEYRKAVMAKIDKLRIPSFTNESDKRFYEGYFKGHREALEELKKRLEQLGGETK